MNDSLKFNGKEVEVKVLINFLKILMLGSYYTICGEDLSIFLQFMTIVIHGYVEPTFIFISAMARSFLRSCLFVYVIHKQSISLHNFNRRAGRGLIKTLLLNSMNSLKLFFDALDDWVQLFPLVLHE